MTVTDNRTRVSPMGRRMSQVILGDTFTGRIGTITGTFLRTYDGIVNLENSRHTWSGGDPMVENFCPVKASVVIEE